MVLGMATSKITITVRDEQLQRIRELVGAGRSASVSGFVQHSIDVVLGDIAGWGAMLASALTDTGGPITLDERAWADEALGLPTQRRGSAA
jgi:Arc/MetJ-type ribon-helix-helix transcriptional regulator